MPKNRPNFQGVSVFDIVTVKQVSRVFKYRSNELNEILNKSASYQVRPCPVGKQLPLFPSSFVHLRGGCPKTGLHLTTFLVWGR